MKPLLSLAVLLIALPALAQDDPADARPAPAPARAAESSECFTLTEEMKKLAQKNAWAGVDRVYSRQPSADGVSGPGYQLLGCSNPDTLFLAAQASRALGDTREYMRRLLAANKACSAGCAQATRDTLTAEAVAFFCNYGVADPAWVLDPARKKELDKAAKKGTAAVSPLIVRPEGFFEPDKNKALDTANAKLLADGQFSSYLPVGNYTVDGQAKFITADSARLLKALGLSCPK